MQVDSLLKLTLSSVPFNELLEVIYGDALKIANLEDFTPGYYMNPLPLEEIAETLVESLSEEIIFKHYWDNYIQMYDSILKMYISRGILVSVKNGSYYWNRREDGMYTIYIHDQYSGVSKEEYKDIREIFLNIMDMGGRDPVPISPSSIPERMKHLLQCASKEMKIDLSPRDIILPPLLTFSFYPVYTINSGFGILTEDENIILMGEDKEGEQVSLLFEGENTKLILTLLSYN